MGKDEKRWKDMRKAEKRFVRKRLYGKGKYKELRRV
jgi:hypothetical protein